MQRFSQRVGAVEVPKVLQLDGMSAPLRNTIWNVLVSVFGQEDYAWDQVVSFLAQFFLKFPVDSIPTHNTYRHWFKERYFQMPWHEVYDLTEFVAEHTDKLGRKTGWNADQFRLVLNKVFEDELSGYRFIAEQLAPIASEVESAAIESALETTSRQGLDGAHLHIATALKLLAKRPEPDYRNSMKESISAVESIAKLLGRDASGLAPALDELGKKVALHPALKAAFVKLYGYTSDEGGIRHALLEESAIGYDDAKYMVVACSAFVNYLAAKAQNAGVLAAR